MHLQEPTEPAPLPAPPDESPADLPAQIDFARFTHANLQEMVKLADSKATALTAVLSVVLTLLGREMVTAAAGSLASWLPGPTAFWALALILPTLAAVLLHVRVLYPNWRIAEVIPPKNASRLVWSGPADLGRYGNSADNLYLDLKGSLPSQHLADIAYENLKIARIVDEKFARVAFASRWLHAALISWAVIVWLSIFK